ERVSRLNRRSLRVANSGRKAAVLADVLIATRMATHPADLPKEPPMKPRITVLTLAVADLERAVAFYRDGMGLPTEGITGREFDHGAVAFFDLAGGLKLAVWP